MKISVVIPTFRRKELLARCIDALMSQQFPAKDFEIVVVSDGPDHQTMEVVNSFASKSNGNIRFLFTPNKRGPAAARNLGWKASTASLIAFTDDDCIPDTEWLTAMWRAYNSSQTNLIAFAGTTIVPISNPPTDYELNIAQLATAEFITANCACSRSALQLTGGFDEDFTMAWREDSDLQFKFIRNKIPILRVAAAYVTHPVRKHKWAVSIKEERKSQFNVLLCKKHPELYRKKIGSHVPLNYYAIVIGAASMLTAIAVGLTWLSLLSLLLFIILIAQFAWKRLRNTTHSPEHVSEMVVTSFALPFLSVYYHLYGTLKYCVFPISSKMASTIDPVSAGLESGTENLS